MHCGAVRSTKGMNKKNLIAIAQLRMRCVMTTFDPDTLKQDVGVLRRIVKSPVESWLSIVPSKFPDRCTLAISSNSQLNDKSLPGKDYP
jgi:hypothetical protein